MKKRILFYFILIFVFILIFSNLSYSFSGTSAHYVLTHGNINYVNSHNETNNYVADYSVVEQPILNSQSTNFFAYLGFYYTGMISFIEEEIGWWFLAVVTTTLSMVFLLYIPMKRNPNMKIPLSIGTILLIFITLNILLVGIELFADTEIISGAGNIIETFYSIISYLIPFIFTIWIIAFISGLIKSKINFKNSKM